MMTTRISYTKDRPGKLRVTTDDGTTDVVRDARARIDTTALVRDHNKALNGQATDGEVVVVDDARRR